MSKKRRKRRGITRKQAIRRRRITKLIFFSIIIFSLYLIVYKTKIFNIKKINVRGNKKIVTEEIIKKSTFKEGFKTFNFEKKQGEENIEKLPYIKSAEIKRKFPNVVDITIVERIPVAMASYIDKYILIDKEGYTLEYRNKTEELEYPDISGIEINNVKEGQNLFQGKYLKDQSQFLDLLIKNSLLNKIRYINFSDMNDIVLELEMGEKIFLGNLNSMDEKLIFLNKTLKNLEEKEIKASKIELRDPSKAIVSKDDIIEELENIDEDSSEEVLENNSEENLESEE